MAQAFFMQTPMEQKKSRNCSLVSGKAVTQTAARKMQYLSDAYSELRRNSDIRSHKSKMQLFAGRYLAENSHPGQTQGGMHFG